LTYEGVVPVSESLIEPDVSSTTMTSALPVLEEELDFPVTLRLSVYVPSSFVFRLFVY